MGSEGTLDVMAQDFKGGNWSYEGTRPEIEAWLEKRGNHTDISVIVRDDTNITVGRKHFGQKEITWCQRSLKVYQLRSLKSVPPRSPGFG